MDLGTLRGLLPDAVDIYAVDYRAELLNKLQHILANYSEELGNENPISCLKRFNHDEDFDDCVITVMARIPVEWMQLGYVYSGWPFDVDEFIRQVEQEARVVRYKSHQKCGRYCSNQATTLINPDDERNSNITQQPRKPISTEW